MQETGRKGKAARNLLYGAGAQVIQSVFPFISRTVFIYTLGAEYLGISSLFSSILSVLSLAELGLGNVVVYSLYKPVADRDLDKIKAYVAFYQTIYRMIAVVILLVGMALIPFLQLLVNLPANMDHIILYYALYVLNSSMSYLFIYKSSIISADQKQYIITKYHTIFSLVLCILQSVVLFFFHQFALYLIVQILCTFMCNCALSLKADHLYGLKNSRNIKLDRQEKNKIFSDTKAMLAYKLGGTFLNSTDSMYISVLVNTVTVGLYANFTVLEGFLNKFVNIMYDAVFAGIGNLNATEGERKQKEIFDVLSFIFMWIASVGLAGFYLCANDVVRIWIGDKYCITYFSVFALALRFYLPIVLYPTWMYRNTTGLFKSTQNILIYAGLINLLLSWPLGKLWGLAGILLATSVSRLLTSFWYEPVVIYKRLFSMSKCQEYFMKIALSFTASCVSIFLSMVICSVLPEGVWMRLAVNGLLAVLVPTAIMIIFYRKTPEWKYLFRRACCQKNRNVQIGKNR